MGLVLSRNPSGELVVLNDSFVRADNTNLSTGGPYSWTEMAQDLEIKTNALHPVTTAAVAEARLDSDLVVNDNWAEAVVKVTKHASLETSSAAAARYQSGANSCYSAFLTRIAATEQLKLYKLVAGVGTVLSTSAGSVPWDTGSVVRCEVKGSCIRGLCDGVEQSRIVDASVATGTRIGSLFYYDAAGGDIAHSALRGGVFLNVPAFSNLTNNGSATDATSYATASVTPTSGTLVLISFTHGHGSALPKDADSVTGASISGAQKIATSAFNSVGTPRTKAELWAATGTGSAGAITIQFGSGSSQTQTGACWSVVQVTNINTGLGTNGVVQSTTSAAAASTSLVTGTLAAFKQDDNPTFAVFGQAINSAITPEAGWVELADVGHNTPTERVETCYTAWSDLAQTATATSGAYGTIICELAAMTTGGSTPGAGFSQAAAMQASNW